MIENVDEYIEKTVYCAHPTDRHQADNKKNLNLSEAFAWMIVYSVVIIVFLGVGFLGYLIVGLI